jgi:ABC-type transport system involved in multi-copper enzyme maturation permease subunit
MKAATTAYRSAVPTGRIGFGQLLRAEWTKLVSVRGWVLGLLAVVVLTLTLSVLGAAVSGTDLNEHPEELGAVGPDRQRVKDEFHLVHQPLTGDGGITARVASQDGSHEWAKAGVMIKQGTEPGSPYAALMVTPGHGVRLQANFATDLPGSGDRAPRWLRLIRSDTTITGHESADGGTWREVGSVDLAALPPTVQVGLFVTSPGELTIERQFGSTSSGERPTRGAATFDNVHVDGDSPRPAAWRDLDTSSGFVDPGSSTEANGVFTLTGSGDIASKPPDTDVAQLGLLGVIFGQIAALAVGVLFITSEYKRGMIRTTLAASPRRGRVLVAKAVVIGSATFGVGLAASVTAFFAAQPVLRGNGFAPPGYPVPSLTTWPVLRAVVGAAVFLALIAMLSLGVGAIARGSAGAITAAIALCVLPVFLELALPLSAARWLVRTTPLAGLAILQTIEHDHETAVEPMNMAPPLVGLGVLAAYAAVCLAVGCWLLHRRDA